MICGKLGMRTRSMGIFNFNLVINEPPMNAVFGYRLKIHPGASSLCTHKKNVARCAVPKSAWMNGNGHAFVIENIAPTAASQPGRVMWFWWNFSEESSKLSAKLLDISENCGANQYPPRVSGHVGEPVYAFTNVYASLRRPSSVPMEKKTSRGESKRYFKPSVTWATSSLNVSRRTSAQLFAIQTTSNCICGRASSKLCVWGAQALLTLTPNTDPCDNTLLHMEGFKRVTHLAPTLMLMKLRLEWLVMGFLWHGTQ